MVPAAPWDLTCVWFVYYPVLLLTCQESIAPFFCLYRYPVTLLVYCSFEIRRSLRLLLDQNSKSSSPQERLFPLAAIMLFLEPAHVLSFLLPATLAVARNVPRHTTEYRPVKGNCPAHIQLVTPASGNPLSDELAYTAKRKVEADKNLGSWLQSRDKGFSTTNLPSLGLTVSGGGWRTLQCGGGVISAFDNRENVKTEVSGIYQSLTYQAGLSGGSWLLSSLAGNNWMRVSDLVTELWHPAFAADLLHPQGKDAWTHITSELWSKGDVLKVTLTDLWGRLLAYQLLLGAYGGVQDRLSTVTSQTYYTQNLAPYPIITAMGVQFAKGQCTPTDDATLYEFTPHTFGSWDKGVQAFMQTAYMGTNMSSGAPVNNKCITNDDNLLYVAGMSSNLFNEVCTEQTATSTIVKDLADAAAKLNGGTLASQSEYGSFANPWYKYDVADRVKNEPYITAADGGETEQNDPIWPFIQNTPVSAHKRDSPHARTLDVLIVNDNSADTEANNTKGANKVDGSQIYNTYKRAQTVGLKRMPVIPPSNGSVYERAWFFGCHEPATLTIIYLPNNGYDGFQSNTSTYTMKYNNTQVDQMVANGRKIATQGGDAKWPTCMACAITMKQPQTLPPALAQTCQDCFVKYCYNPPGTKPGTYLKTSSGTSSSTVASSTSVTDPYRVPNLVPTSSYN